MCQGCVDLREKAMQFKPRFYYANWGRAWRCWREELLLNLLVLRKHFGFLLLRLFLFFPAVLERLANASAHRRSKRFEAAFSALTQPGEAPLPGTVTWLRSGVNKTVGRVTIMLPSKVCPLKTGLHLILQKRWSWWPIYIANYFNLLFLYCNFQLGVKPLTSTSSSPACGRGVLTCTGFFLVE